MAGRGAQEKTFAELKGQWALDAVPTRHYAANSAWQQIAILGHNLLRNFQLQTLATEKPRSLKRTCCYLMQSLKTIRFKLIHQPARLVKPQGYSVLRFSVAQLGSDIDRIDRGETQIGCLNAQFIVGLRLESQLGLAAARRSGFLI